MHFVVTILFALTWDSDEAVLYGNDAFLDLSAFNLKTVLQFFEKEVRFPENLFQS